MHKEYLIDKDLYEVHDGGKIWSKYWKKYLDGSIIKKGYVKVGLKCIDGKYRSFLWHRVIWYLLKGEIPEGMQVNHIDENKQNNHISNLNLMTCKENVNWGTGIERRAEKHKGITRSEEYKIKIRNHPNMSKLVVAVKDGNVVMEFASTQETRRNGFDQGAVSACCRNCYLRQGNNFFKGYQWYFKEDWLKIQQATQSNERVACGKLNIE